MYPIQGSRVVMPSPGKVTACANNFVDKSTILLWFRDGFVPLMVLIWL